MASEERLEFRTVRCAKCGDPDRLIVQTARGTVSSCYSCGDEHEMRELSASRFVPVTGQTGAPLANLPT